MGLFTPSPPPTPTGEKGSTERSIYSPLYQSQSQELGKDMIDSDSMNYKTYLALLGKIQVGEDIIEIQKPFMNEIGASKILMILNSMNTKNTYLTKITDEDVVRITRDLWTIIKRALIHNREEWNLPNDISSWSIIREIVIQPVYFALRRGEGGTEKQFFADTHQSKEVVNQSHEQQFKKGWLS